MIDNCNNSLLSERQTLLYSINIGLLSATLPRRRSSIESYVLCSLDTGLLFTDAM